MTRFFWLMLVVTVLFAGLLWAEEAPPPAPDAAAGAAAPEPASQVTLWTQIRASGAVGVVIILTSMVGMALAIENGMSLRAIKLYPTEVVQELDRLLAEENYEAALKLCEDEPCFLTRVVGAGLAKLGCGFSTMREAMETAVQEEMLALQQKLSYISLIGSLGPLLGLLGTVTGMIISFNEIARLAAPKPSQLAHGIGQALVNTCMGLLVAIPAMTAFLYLSNRVNKLALEVVSVAGNLMDRFRPPEQ